MFNLLNKLQVLFHSKKINRFIKEKLCQKQNDENLPNLKAPIDQEPLLILLLDVLKNKATDKLRPYLSENVEYDSVFSSKVYSGKLEVINRFKRLESEAYFYPDLVSIAKYNGINPIYPIGTLCIAVSYTSFKCYKFLIFIDVNDLGLISKIRFVQDYDYCFNIYGESRENTFSLFNEKLSIRYALSENDYPEKESDEENSDSHTSNDRIKYSLSIDSYDEEDTSNTIKYSLSNSDITALLSKLEKKKNATFVDALIHYIDSKKLKDSSVYKAAGIDRRLFSKLVSNRNYTPSKDTAIALAIALKLSPDETSDLLSRAGYTLSHSNKRDIIIEYFIREKISNINVINEALFSLNEKIIGR